MKTLENITLQRRTLLGSAISTAVLAACGGGGGAGGDAAPAPGDGGGQLPPGTPLPVSKAWQGAQLLELGDGKATAAQVAINEAGVGYAVWLQKDGGFNAIFANRYVNGVWDGAQKISAVGDTGFLSDPQVVVHTNGDASAIWSRSVIVQGVTFYSLEFSYAVKGAWLEGLAAPPGTFFAESNIDNLALATDGSGKALAVLRSTKGNASAIEVIEYLGAERIGGSKQIATGTGTSNTVLSPRLAMASDGAALAVWLQEDNNTEVVMALPYVNGKWSVTPTRIDFNADAADKHLAVAVGANGKAVVVWGEGQIFNTTVRRFLFGRFADDFRLDGWKGFVQPFQTDQTGGSSDPQVTLDSQGRATVVWAQNRNLFGAVSEDICASHFDGIRWSPAQLVANVPGLGAFAPQIASDANGNVMAVWEQFVSNSAGAPRSDIFTSRFDPAAPTKWSQPELLEVNNLGSAFAAQIAMNANGRAIAVWEQGGPPGEQPTTSSINANVFK
jgi:hypothetical protein